MSALETTSVLAVPCDQPIILDSKQSEELLAQLEERRTEKKDKKKLEQDFKVLFTKPDRK
ncbi:MAG: hypothetical protein FWC20_11690 [Oscillospiraceae bacterium]|nr:hypothetical protein [Oscillospiraceae bacterium]MCL2280046.1 hypothetical protein [Oscillospiraceae bacterium]